MLIYNEFAQVAPHPHPTGFTLGSFDGVHLGHRHLIDTLRRKVSPQGTVAALTFRNHPSHFFSSTPHLLLCTFAHKLYLLKEAGVDLLIVQDFNHSFAEQRFDTFLQKAKIHLGFTYFVLGKGATFGQNRQGDETHIKHLCSPLNFEAEYLEKLTLDGHPISSRHIRSLVLQGALQDAARYLGRPYSIYSKLHAGRLLVTGLCLPPPDSYPITLKHAGLSCPGIAHILSPSEVKIDLHQKAPHLEGELVEILFYTETT